MSAIAMSNLSRRQCCAGLLTVLGGLAAGGCLTISPQEEQKLGDKEAKEVERTVGLIRDRGSSSTSRRSACDWRRRRDGRTSPGSGAQGVSDPQFGP